MTRGANLVLSPSRNVPGINLAIRTGNLPRTGGVNEQDEDFVSDLEFVLREIQKAESERVQKWQTKMSGSR